MATKKSLQGLIDDLKYVRDTLSDNDKLNKYYDRIFALLMFDIGKRTAYDTGVARKQIKSILEELGASDLSSELNTEIYNFWKTREEREKEGVTYNFSKQNREYKVTISDYGFSNQNSGKVSDIHPRRDPLVIPHHVDYVIDEFESGVNNQIEKIMDMIEMAFIRAIEKGRW